MMPSILARLKRKWIRKSLALFSLTTAAFIFQACYGVENDYYLDVEITGRVSALDTGSPIEGIMVSLANYYSECPTDSLGRFTLYAPSDTTFLLLFNDVDDAQNGLFQNTKKLVENKSYSNYLEADITLTRIQ